MSDRPSDEEVAWYDDRWLMAREVQELRQQTAELRAEVERLTAENAQLKRANDVFLGITKYWYDEADRLQSMLPPEEHHPDADPEHDPQCVKCGEFWPCPEHLATNPTEEGP